MSEVVDVQYNKPVPEFVTVKLTRADAQDLIRAYQDAWKREPYFFSLWGRQSPLVDQVKKAIGDKVEPKASMSLGEQLLRSYGVTAR